MSGEHLGFEIHRSRVEPAGSGPEVRSPNRRVLLISGITASDPRNKGFVNAFNREYEENNVMVMSSVISKDKRDRGRWKKMRDFITTSDEQAGIDIVVHSMGAGELYKVIRGIEKEDPDFFKKQKNKDRFNFVLIDPSGFNIGRQKIEYAKNTLRLMREHGNLGNLSPERTWARGVDSLIAFPIQGLSPDEMQDLASGVRKIFPQLSTPQERERFRSIHFDKMRDHMRDHTEYLDAFVSDTDRAKVQIYDTIIKDALRRGDLTHLEDSILERGELLKWAVERIYESRLEEPLDKTEKGRLRFSGSEGVRMLFTAVGRRPMDKFRQLLDMGYNNINILSPENSIAVPLRNLVQMFDSPEQAASHIRIPELLPHAGYSQQPGLLVKDIRDLRGNGAGGILTA